MIFLFHVDLVEEILPKMVQKTMNLQVFPNLKCKAIMFTNFDLWMSRGGVDTFALVINSYNDSWIPMHVTVGLFEVHDTTRASMVGQLEFSFGKYDLTHHVIAFVKDEGNNLTSMTTTLHSINQPLKLQKVYEGMCFSHIMSNVCQYATNDSRNWIMIWNMLVWRLPKVVYKRWSHGQKN